MDRSSVDVVTLMRGLLFGASSAAAMAILCSLSRLLQAFRAVDEDGAR